MAIKYSIILSTTEPNNEVGVIKIRQADEQTQMLDVQITENGVPKSYKDLDVYFCAKLGQTAGLGIIEQKLKPEEMTDPINGKLVYTMRAEDWQILGRQRGYFSFRKMKMEHEFVEQFTTRDFSFEVIKSVYSDGLKEVKKDGSTYVWTIEDLIRLFNEYIVSGKSDWEEFVEQNREVLESVDPGGLLLSELIRSRKPAGADVPYKDVPERLDKQIGLNSDFRSFEADESFMQRVYNEQVERGVNVKWFGARGDGIHDDSNAINDCINYVHARGGGTVLLPENSTFLLKTKRGGHGTFIQPRPNVNIKGSETSVLKADAGFKSIFNMIAHWAIDFPGEKLENCTFEGFTIDHNGENNLVETATLSSTKCLSIGAIDARNIKIRNIKVRNNAGRQCFMFGGLYNGVYYTPDNIVITENEVLSFGAGVVGNTLQTDHSCIYLNGTNMLISKNRFINPLDNFDKGLNVGTAIELHCSDSVVTDNYFERANIGIIVASSIENIDNLEISGNRGTTQGAAIELWTNEGYKTSNLYIAKNKIKSGNYGFKARLDRNKYLLENIYLQSNEFRRRDPSVIKSEIYSGILLDNVAGNITIDDNVVAGFSGKGIEISLSMIGNKQIKITKNTLINNNNNTSDSPVHLAAIAVLGGVDAVGVISDNFVEKNNGKSEYWLYLNSNCRDMLIKDNQVFKNAKEHINPSNITDHYLVLLHAGYNNPKTSNLKSSPGSVYYNKNTQIRYTKSVTNNQYNWRIDTKSNTISSLPDDGDLTMGDTAQIINDNTVVAMKYSGSEWKRVNSI